MKKKTSRIEEEKQVVKLMIELYCRKKEKHDQLCEECRMLLDYAWKRLDHCKFGEQKVHANVARSIAINPICERRCGK